MRSKKQHAGRAPGGKDNGMSDALSDYIPAQEAADLLGVASGHVRHLLIDGKLKGKKMGNGWIVFKPSLEEYERTKSAAGRPRSGEPQI